MPEIPHANRLLMTDLPGADIPVAPPRLTTTHSQLSTLISEALRRGLVAKFFASLGGESQLRENLRDVCVEAKSQNMRIEYVIIAFKDAWRALPEARTLPQGSQGPEFLNRVITLCIAEYFDSARAD